MIIRAEKKGYLLSLSPVINCLRLKCHLSPFESSVLTFLCFFYFYSFFICPIFDCFQPKGQNCFLIFVMAKEKEKRKQFKNKVVDIIPSGRDSPIFRFWTKEEKQMWSNCKSRDWWISAMVVTIVKIDISKNFFKFCGNINVP